MMLDHESILQLEGIARDFDADGQGQPPRAILERIDLSVRKGEIVALVGRSGAGKTTLLHIAAGLCRPTRGKVFFDGKDLWAMPVAEASRLRRGPIGLVFQNNLTLAALPVWENTAVGQLMNGERSRQARREAESLLEQVGLAGYAGSPTSALSGGQRRRLGLARALAGDPQLLLADEPTADLDETTAQEIQDLMLGWLRERGRTCLIVTHDRSMMQSADRIVALQEGRLRPVETVLA